MLTNAERRFIKSWEEQRKGGKWKYYLLYMSMGTVISSIVFSFLSVMLRIGFPDKIWLIITASFFVVTISTIITWFFNEKKFKAIIRREIEQAKTKED